MGNKLDGVKLSNDLIGLADSGELSYDKLEAARKRSLESMPVLTVGIVRAADALSAMVDAVKSDGVPKPLADMLRKSVGSILVTAVLTVYLLGYNHARQDIAAGRTLEEAAALVPGTDCPDEIE